jgi:hypothetical protein
VNCDAASTFSFHQVIPAEAERLGHAPDSTSASMRKVGGGIPLARDEAKSLSRLTRVLQSLYPVNTGAREPACPAGKMFATQGPKDMPEPRELRRNDGFC